MQSDETWRVDSYQVPVPLGDCSLHFSVRKKKGGQPEVQTAIIVDGGSSKNTNGKSAKEMIEDTVVEVTTKYKKFPGFHYWLVTHWDDDHYAGALEYFKEKEPPVEVFGPVSWNDENLGVLKEDREDMENFLKHTTFTEYKIGQDFFQKNNVFELPQGVNFIEWFKSLVQDKKADSMKPIFLCVAANGYCFNDSKGSLQIDDGIKTPEHKNATSAFFIIAWPGSRNICYYAAGDGNVKIEKHFQETKFLEPDADNGALVLKGTHHGAFKAFNAELFGQMKPRNYVVSAGSKFGHPTAALLVLFAIHKLDQPEDSKFTLYTSRYPYWLAEDPKTRDKRFLNTQRIQTMLKDYDVVLKDHKLDDMFTSIKDSVADLNKIKFEKLKDGLNLVWTFLTDSDPPSVPEDQGKPYRVHMHFNHAILGKSVVNISVYASEEVDDDWNEE